MSSSWGSDTDFPSYALNQVPPVILQLSPVSTDWPSRLRTTSRGSQPPPCELQCGNFARLYPDIEAHVPTVSESNCARAALLPCPALAPCAPAPVPSTRGPHPPVKRRSPH